MFSKSEGGDSKNEYTQLPLFTSLPKEKKKKQEQEENSLVVTLTSYSQCCLHSRSRVEVA